MRLRKAWTAELIGHHYDDSRRDVVFGETASKARYAAWLSLSDCWSDVKLTQMRVLRAKDRDVLLPDPDPVLEAMSTQERECLIHAFGGNQGGSTIYQAGRRDYFYTHTGDASLVRLVERGLMTGPHGVERSADRDMGYFYLSDAGKNVALSAMPTYAS